ASGEPRKNRTKMPQNTSGGMNAPGAYENASQHAITTSVAVAPARCRSARARTHATTNNPASTSSRKPNSNHGRLPNAGTVLKYTANTSGMAAALSAVYSKAESELVDPVERTPPRAIARPASAASGNTAKMPIPSGSDPASRNLMTQSHW